MSRLSRYVWRTALVTLVPLVLGLTGLLSLLEFVEQLGFVGQGGYHVADAFTYTLLTAPGRLLQVLSVSVLLATLLTLGGLAERSEYVAMMSLGVPERRISASILWLVPGLTIFLLVLAQWVVPPAQGRAQAERTAALAASASYRTDDALWAQGNHEYLNVRRFRSSTDPQGINIYTLSPQGGLSSVIHAEHGTIRPDGTWMLADVTLKHVGAAEITESRQPALAWQSFIVPRQMRSLLLPIGSMPPLELYSYLRTARLRHLRAPRYDQALWQTLAAPVSMVAMIVLGGALASGRPRVRNTRRTVAIGTGLGLAYLLGQQVVTHFGLLLGVAEPVPTLVPPLLLMWLATSLAGRLRRDE